MKTVPALAALGLSVCLSLGLGGCGKMGDLERPGPLYGSDRSTTRRSDEAVRQAQDPNRPVNTVDSRDITTDPAPPRTLPIQGAGQDPTRSAPQGALPNPYSNPR